MMLPFTTRFVLSLSKDGPKIGPFNQPFQPPVQWPSGTRPQSAAALVMRVMVTPMRSPTIMISPRAISSPLA